MNIREWFIGKRLLCLIVAFFMYIGLQAQETLTLNLEKALIIAQSESPTVKVAEKEIIKKGYAREEVIAGLFPVLSANGGYSYTIKKQRFAMMGQSIEVGSDNNWNVGLNLSLPIYAPTLYKSIGLSHHDIQLAMESSRASKINLVNQVTKAYFQLLMAQDSYEVLKKGYAHAEENFTVVSNKFKQGLVSEYDKIRAEVQVRNLRPSVISTENAINLTKLQLKVLIGLDANQDVLFQGSLADYESGMYAGVISIDTTTTSNNSDLKQLDIQSKILNKQLELNRTAYLPTISLSSMFTYISMNDNFKFGDYKWNPYSTVGFTVSMPIYQKSRSLKVKQTKMQMEQLELNKLNLTRNVDVMMRNYMNNMQKSVEQLASNKESVKQAEKGCSIARKRYEVGKGTILELNDSELALTQSKLAYNQAIYDYLSAKADLDKVLGKEINK